MLASIVMVVVTGGRVLVVGLVAGRTRLCSP